MSGTATPPVAPAAGTTVTVSADGPKDGVEFGPGNSPSGTNGFLEAVRSGASRIVVRGGFQVVAPTNLRSDLELAFDGASIGLGANTNIFQAGGQSRLRVTGSVRFDGGRARGFNGFGFLLNGCSDVRFDWDCRVEGFASDPHRSLINANPAGTRPGRTLVLRGRTVTIDSAVLRACDYSDVEVSGVSTPPGGLTAAVPLAPVAVLSDGVTGPVRNVYVHDCDLDGGGVQKVSGLVRVFGAPGNGHIVGVHLENLRVGNTIPIPSDGLSDGVDVNHAEDVTIRGVTGGRVCDLVSCVASRAVVENCTAVDCNGIGILVGDGGSQTEAIEDVVVRGCTATNCGRGLKFVNAAGMGVAATRGSSTRKVRFENCTSKDSTGSAQRYGFSINALGGIDEVEIVGGALGGFERAVVNPSGRGLRTRGVAGTPDLG
jgi:hypothetical protein